MGFDPYREPPSERSQQARTVARMITSLIEEAEAIGWYEQRMAVETDPEARAVMANAQEEFKPFAGLDFLLRRKDERTEMNATLFTSDVIVERGEMAEQKVD